MLYFCRVDIGQRVLIIFLLTHAYSITQSSIRFQNYPPYAVDLFLYTYPLLHLRTAVMGNSALMEFTAMATLKAASSATLSTVTDVLVATSKAATYVNNFLDFHTTRQADDYRVLLLESEQLSINKALITIATSETETASELSRLGIPATRAEAIRAKLSAKPKK